MTAIFQASILLSFVLFLITVPDFALEPKKLWTKFSELAFGKDLDFKDHTRRGELNPPDYRLRLDGFVKACATKRQPQHA